MPGDSPDPSKILAEFFRLVFIPKYSFVLWAGGLMLFCGPELPAFAPYLTAFRERFGVYAAPLTVMAFMAWCIEVLWAGVARWYAYQRLRTNAHAYLWELSQGEAMFFANQLLTKKRAATVDANDEDVPHLVDLGLLIAAGGRTKKEQVVLIPDDAWKYLERNRDNFFRHYNLPCDSGRSKT